MTNSNETLTARSVLASALLGVDPPELPVAHLLHLASLFGISGNRARVALSRMLASGEVTSPIPGRYRLAGHLLDRQHRQAISRLGTTKQWSGKWLLAVVTTAGSDAPVRAGRRRALRFMRFAELREGVWLRPDNLEFEPIREMPESIERFVAEPMSDPKQMATLLWDLEGWAEQAKDLLLALQESPTTSTDDLAPGFILSASVLRHLQADPLLPSEILPDDWPGEELRKFYAGWDLEYRTAIREWGRLG